MQLDATGDAAGGEAASLAALNTFKKDLLGYRSKIGRIVKPAEAAPSCALANTWAAALWLLTKTRKGHARPASFLDRAEKAAETEREHLALGSIRASYAGDTATALALCAESVARCPRDLVAVKLGQDQALNSGNTPVCVSCLCSRPWQTTLCPACTTGWPLAMRSAIVSRRRNAKHGM